jgi:hypothetical protein
MVPCARWLPARPAVLTAEAQRAQRLRREKPRRAFLSAFTLRPLRLCGEQNRTATTGYPLANTASCNNLPRRTHVSPCFKCPIQLMIDALTSASPILPAR